MKAILAVDASFLYAGLLAVAVEATGVNLRKEKEIESIQFACKLRFAGRLTSLSAEFRRSMVRLQALALAAFSPLLLSCLPFLLVCLLFSGCG